MEDKPTYTEQTLSFVKREHVYDEVYTYAFSTDETVSYTAGQYGHIRVSGMPDGVRAVREFSFASAPHDALIEFEIDYKARQHHREQERAPNHP
jgi:NAD(P)H-flavin reductase